MKTIKLIENLISKASNSNDGVAIINGRMSMGYGIKGELEEKYKVEYDYPYGAIRLYHWGTFIIELDLSSDEIVEYYGQSNSDRDAINTLLWYFDLSHKYKSHWYPSLDEFIIKEVE